MLAWDNDYTHEESVKRRRGSHAGPTRELPGLVKYVTSIPTDPERPEYDGTVRPYFKDMTTLKAAFDSKVSQRVSADVVTFTDIGRGPTLYVEETTHLDRSRTHKHE